MVFNGILRNIREALALDEAAMRQVFAAAGRDVSLSTIAALTSPEGEDGHIPCAAPILGFFLDGLIIHRRGRKEGQPAVAAPVAHLSSNDILKKLRIALDLKEDDVAAVFRAGRADLTKNDLGALFRKEGNTHFKECSDELLGCFLKGLSTRNASAGMRQPQE